MTKDEAIKEARACVRDGCEYASADLVRGLLEAYDEARADVVRLARERDEARAELDHMRQGYDRLRADRDYHCDRAIAAAARAERAEAALAETRDRVRSHLTREELSMLPADLAAERDRRVRAETVRKVREAALALEAARREDVGTSSRRMDALRAESSAGTLKAVAEMLATMAVEIERGER